MTKVNKVLTLLMVALLFVPLVSRSFGASAHPDLENKIRSGEVDTPEHLLGPRLLLDAGVNQPTLHPISETYPTGAGPVGSYNALVLLVDFSDNPSSVGASYFDTLIFNNQQGCVRHYYQEVSYGTLDIVTVNLPSTTGWNTAPQTYTYYVNWNYALGGYPNNSQKLVEDLVALVDPVIDFSAYDNDGDTYVDALIVVHAGPGAELTGDTSDVWSHKWSVPYPWTAADGVNVRDYTIQPEYWYSAYDMTCGVYCHELGHVFGLPDLYDTDYTSYGVGEWSLMASGSWNGSLGASPAHPDAWCLARLGYVTPTVVSSNTSGASVPAIQDSAKAYKLWTSGSPANEYFLAANRQQTGYDSALPSSGLLIWHVDESIADYGANDDEWYPGHTSSGHFKVALEQADGLWELESTIPFGYVDYSGDPYPGSSEEYHASTPSAYDLGQNYPNPFNPGTRIEYSVPRDGHVTLTVYNVLGERVRTLVDRKNQMGIHKVSWDGTDDEGTPVANGIYFYQLKAETFVNTNKMVLLK
jgi:immune inhibitor A